MAAVMRVNFFHRMHSPCLHAISRSCAIWCKRQDSDVGYSGTSWPVSVNLCLLFACLRDFNFLHGTCVGQAQNPGPWTISTYNIVSANKHLDDFSLHTNCMVWTETSATKATQERAVRKAKSLHNFVQFSNPSPVSGRKARVGKPDAMGVMIFSDVPSRDLSGEWDEAIFRTARISDVFVNVANTRIRVIGIYGFHSGIPDNITQNDRLMAHVLSVASRVRMPTIITGDLNCDISSLQAWQQARSIGYVDVACRQAQLHGVEPDPTYRGTSRLDYVLCDPIAATAFLQLQVDPRGYTDHALLTAKFDWTFAPQTIPSWTFPRDVFGLQFLRTPIRETKPLPHCADEFLSKLAYGTVDEAFNAFNKSFEQKVQHVHSKVTGRALNPAFLGRGQGHVVQLQQPLPRYSKHGRQLCAHIAISQRLRVREWLLELTFHAGKGNALAKQHDLWRKILSAPGFKPDFGSWVLENDLVQFVPLGLPSHQWLQNLLDNLVFEFQHWDSWQVKQRRHSVSEAFKADWQKGGRLHATMVKGANWGTLDSLVQSTRLRVRLCRATRGKPAIFAVHDNSQVIPGAIWSFDEHESVVSSCMDGKVTLTAPPSEPMAQRVVLQKTWTTDTAYILEQVRGYWENSGMGRRKWIGMQSAPWSINCRSFSSLMQLLPRMN